MNVRPTLRYLPHETPIASRSFPRQISVADSHTCGQPTRVITTGTGLTPGMDPLAARAELAGQRDWIRHLVVMEPRGHRSMFGVAMIPPASKDDLFGAVYMDANGYPDMCGHATIGFATTLFALGLMAPDEPDATGSCDFAIRTPMGEVALTARLEGGVCRAVAFRSPLAYYLGAVDLALGDGRSCRVDVAQGGQWYAFVPVEVTGLSVAPRHIDALIAAAEPVRRALAEQCTLVDPVSGAVPQVGNIVWIDKNLPEGAQGLNVPVSASGSFDRSPCGTATCARMVTLAAQGLLAVDQPFVNQGLVGTRYFGRLVARREVPDAPQIEGYVPQVEGSAWMTGQGVLFADPADPLGEGFLCP